MSEPSREQQLDAILHSYLQAVDAGRQPDPAEIVRRHPAFAEELRAFFADQEKLARFARSLNKVCVDQTTVGRDETRYADESTALPRIRYFGDYELLEEVARGGMGVVYKAKQVSLNRVVALKMILAGQLATEADVARFRSEAEAAGKLDHPHIVPIHEIGQHEGQHYFTMKLIDGGSLAGERNMPRRTAARLVAVIARAVHHAHQRGILHRDLKPGNILIDRQGEPHVTDFGLARRVDGDSGLTRSGAIVGTPSYMAPEQARSEKVLTTAVDVYSLGAILYELLTGRPPFRAETPLDTVLQVLEREAERPRKIDAGIDRDLETIALKCLNKDPEQRYESAAALADDLERWQRGEPIMARRAGSMERLVKWCRRRPAAAALIGVIAFALAALVAVGSYFNIRLQEQVDTAQANQYVAHMNRMENDWENSDFTRVLDTLDIYRRDRAGRRDVRGWEWHYQERLCHQALRTLKGHTDIIYAVAFSPDGTQVASASRDGTVKMWDSVTGKELRTIQEARDPKRQQIFAVWALAFSPDGKRLATGHEFGDVRLWDLADGREMVCIKGDKVCRSLAFSPDGRHLAGHATFTVQVWDTTDGTTIRTVRPWTNSNSCVAYSPDGRFLVVAGGDIGKNGVAHLYDARNPKDDKIIRSFVGHTNVIMSAAFHPDGTRLATASWDGTIKIWDVAEGKELRTLVGHGKSVTSVAFSPDGARLASAGADRTVRLWDAGSGQELRVCRGHTNAISYVHDEGGWGYWADFQNAVYSVACSPDGTRLASGGVDGTVKLWDTATDQQPRIILDPPGAKIGDQGPGVLARAISPDGKLLALVSKWEGSARLCDARTGQQLRILEGLAKTDRGEPGVAFGPDSARLAATTGDGTVVVWDANSGQKLHSFSAHAGLSLGVAFSPDGARLATAGVGPFVAGFNADSEVKLWDSATAQELHTIRPKYMGGSAQFLAFGPGWKRLALADERFSLQIWDVGTGRKLHEYGPNSFSSRAEIAGETASNVRAMAFSPDGVHVALGFANGKVDLRNANTGRLDHILQGHAGIVDAVTFSPDGKRLVTGHRDGTVKLWDMATAQLVRTLKGHTRVVRSLGFSKDGTLLMSSALDGTVRLWDARSLTPDLASELEAVALLDSLFARPLPRSAVKSLVSDRLHIDSDVRRRALELADVYAEEADPMPYYVAAWPVIRHPFANEAMTESALAQTAAASALHGTKDEFRRNGWYGNYFNQDGKVVLLKTNYPGDHLFRGMAHYRMGRFKKEHYKQALAILSKCQSHHPTTLAFLAMTQYQLGQRAQAEATLGHLREVLKTVSPEQSKDGQMFLSEATALIEQ